ncbi:hypothetical protein KY285_030042 [Solanum tuberosum]|nr:hypothetical protein KY285_030042 [Solanum tuberosum]
MQINQNLHNIRMMTEVPRTLKEWWGNIRVAYGNEIMPHLGSLTDLLNVEANKSLITLMIEFWQPTTSTIGPAHYIRNQFSLVFEFEGRPACEELMKDGLNWIICLKGSIVVIAMIGSLKNSSSPGLIARDLALLSSLRPFWIWVLEHFYQRHVENGAEADLRNKIKSHAMRLSMWDAPNDEDGCRSFLTTSQGTAFNGDYRFQPYAPLRVLRQFGITQGVPLWSNIALIEVNYEGRISIERIAALVQGWCGILDSDIGVESWCTPEYYTWFMIGGILARPSYEGILGFTDTQRSNQIGMELLNLMHITTTMYQQVTPRSIDHLIQAVDDERNEEMEEDPEEDPRKPTEEMEDDLEEYSEHDPNLYDPRDGGVKHIKDEHVPTVEDAHSEYGSIGFDEREDSNNWEWKIDESSEYQPGTYYDLGGDDAQPGRRSSFFFEFPKKLLKRPYDLSLLYALWPPLYIHFFGF